MNDQNKKLEQQTEGEKRHNVTPDMTNLSSSKDKEISSSAFEEVQAAVAEVMEKQNFVNNKKENSLGYGANVPGAANQVLEVKKDQGYENLKQQEEIEDITNEKLKTARKNRRYNQGKIKNFKDNWRGA